MKPSAAGPYQSHNFQQQQRRQDDPIEIPRPSNYSYTTKPAPEPLFSSKPLSTGLAKAASNIKSFVDLTTSDIGFTTNNSQFKDEFGSADAYAYVDAAKANENIKALLEGAFEDEDDQPRTRLRKKKIEKQVADLAAKLGGVKVSDGKPDASGEAAEEEEEEEEDDGSREGLKVRLLPHQIEGVEWMRDKEAGLKKTRGVLPKGGILADDMGLGKTVQTIALLLCNPRPPRVESDSKKDKTKLKISNEVGKGTLVVAPVALIKQWESEIETKVLASHRLRVCVYHGPGRTKYATRLNDYDVVITTYGTLSSEHASSGTSANGKRTGCFGVHWYRIVLDEAHTIKNRNAKATQAAYALNSEYRWCLTGTPMQNNLDELQSLIRFLRIKPYDELAAWREQITRPLNNGRGGLAIRRLRVYLKAFMKRRTKDVLKLDGALGNGGTSDQANGKSSHGFQITEREILKIEADFSDEEREFYTRLEQRADKSLEKMIGRNNLSYASALVLLLRLRQACNHPDLVKGDLAEEKEALVVNEQSKRSGTDDVDSIADMLGGLTVVSRRCDVCQLDLTKEEASRGVVRCADCDGDLSIVAPKKPSKQKKTKKKKTKPTPPQKSDEYTSRPSGRRRNRPIVIDSDDEEEAEWIVPENERGSTNLGTAGGADDEDAEGGGEWLGSDDSATEEETEDEEEEEEDEDDSEAEEVGQSRADQVIASTKIRRLMKILKHESGSYKFIVFSVFTSMLDKIEPFLKTAKIGYARYDGKMRNDMREASLHKLRNSTRTRVLLCSLRAGSLGLNLTAASRVVILEPFWNPVSRPF
jgi:SNF2 family DNA or RNA helicase